MPPKKDNKGGAKAAKSSGDTDKGFYSYYLKTISLLFPITL